MTAGAGLDVAVRVRSDWHTRVVVALAAHRSVRSVAMIGRSVPETWKGVVVRRADATGADVVVDPDPDDPGVHVSLGAADRGITHAGPEGLARALAARFPEANPVWTVPGEPLRSGTTVSFPAPIGAVWSVDGEAPLGGDFAGAAAVAPHASLAVVDDRRFLSAACAAAAAMIALPDPGEPLAVWDRADRFVASCESFGLVVAAG